jgi:hypothetical protein
MDGSDLPGRRGTAIASPRCYEPMSIMRQLWEHLAELEGPAGPLQQEEADELQAARTANRELTRQLNVNAP